MLATKDRRLSVCNASGQVSRILAETGLAEFGLVAKRGRRPSRARGGPLRA
jgi:hypothetical protein